MVVPPEVLLTIHAHMEAQLQFHLILAELVVLVQENPANMTTVTEDLVELAELVEPVGLEEPEAQVHLAPRELLVLLEVEQKLIFLVSY